MKIIDVKKENNEIIFQLKEHWYNEFDIKIKNQNIIKDPLESPFYFMNFQEFLKTFKLNYENYRNK